VPAGRPASLVDTCDQWARATHQHTAVEGTRGELLLSWTEPPLAPSPSGSACPARGLATDRLCRVYRLHATAVDRLVVGPTAGGLDYVALPDPVVVVGGTPAGEAPGPEFRAPATSALADAVGIAIDEDDRLFLADRATQSIAVLDLWSRRLLRTVSVATGAHPARHALGLASRGPIVYAVLRAPAGLLRLTATRGPEEVPLPSTVADLPPDAVPSRVAVLADGAPVVLFHDGAGDGWLVAGERAVRDVGPASDIVADAEGAVVVAPCPSADGRATLRRLAPTGGGWARTHPLDASGYDGSGLVVTRDGRVGYFTAAGFRLAVIAPVAYETEGICVTYRLDSGTPRNRWGRLFLEACIPDGTSCLVGASTSDDDYVTQVPHAPPEPADCVPAALAPSAPPPPPLPPPSLVPDPGSVAGGLHRRPGPVTPWWPGDEVLATFEAPVTAPPGRYLWVTLRLRGNQRRTPRVREVRVERPAHTLLRRLPGAFSADERQAEFLHRYLATFDGLLHDLDLRSRCRDILVDPSGTPAEALDWLASFVGLVLDDRWAEAARRRLVAEIVPLYRRRGTLGALARYIAIYLAGEGAGDTTRLAVEPVIVEHFRLRGVGPLLGDDPTTTSRSVLGAGLRVGGAVGSLDERPVEPGVDRTSVFATHAHRFSVLIPRSLSADEDAAIRHIVDTERPAHTAYELCTVDAGMRVGRGAHLGLSSVVGPTGAFTSAVLGRALLGRGGILGGRTTGIAVEAGRVGSTTRVG
jgi:phage tail-like protein